MDNISQANKAPRSTSNGMKHAAVVGLVGAGILVSLVLLSYQTTEPCRATVSLGTTTYAVEIADTPLARAKGLSGHVPLAEHGGMLFIFETPTVPGFWMKDMLFPIDIVWIRENKTIAGAVEHFTPASFPRVETPPEPVRYVLELPAGSIEKEKMELDTPVTISEC